MPGIGSRISGLHLRPQALSASIDLQGSRLWPDKNWTGEPGTGFLITPTDPTRTTAKPAVHLLTAPNQRFTNSHQVSVMAYANANGTLIGGIDRLRFHLEGNTLDVVEPTLRTFTRSDGSTYLAVPYSVNIARPSGGPVGDMHLYIEAIPADATMQSRVLGPYLYSFAATPYALQLEIAATPDEITGVRYKTLEAALNYIRTSSTVSALITFTESATVAPYTATVAYAGAESWITITHAPGVTVTFAKSTFSTVDPSFRMRVNLLHFKGRGMVFDWRNVSHFRLETDDRYWLDDVTFTNSDPAAALGRTLWAKGPRPLPYLFTEPCYFTDVHCDWAYGALDQAELARGVTVDMAVNDLANRAKAVVHCTVESADNTAWWNDYPDPVMSITYDTASGDGAAATVEAPGENNEDKVFTFKVDGATVGTFTMLNNWAEYEGSQYNVSDLVDYINGTLAGIDPGFSAELFDDSRKGSWLGLLGGNGKGFTAQDLTDVTFNLYAEFDLHTDFIQFGDNNDHENTIIAHNVVKNWDGQIIWFGGFDETVGNDIAVVSCVFQSAGGGHLSHVNSRTMSHVMVAHNTWIDQVFGMGGDATWGAYSLIANNTAPGMLGAVGDGVVVKNNHVESGGERFNSGRRITGGINDSIGGTAATNFVDAAGGDFTPAGALLLNGKAPAVAFDANGRARKAIEVMGAIGSGALAVTEYVAPSPKTEWDFLDFQEETTGTGQAEIVSASVGRAHRIDASNRAALSLPLLAGTYRLRGTLSQWTGFGSVQLRLAAGDFPNPANITPDSGAGLFSAAGAVDTVFTLAADATFVLFINNSARAFTLTKGADPLLVKTA